MPLFWLECMFEWFLRSFGGEGWGVGRSSVADGRGGNSKLGLMPPLIALGLLLCPRGVKSAETVPGRRLGG